MRKGLDRLASIEAAAAHVDVRPSSEGYRDLVLALDLRAAIIAAEATLRCAVERRESRGAHQRKDHPDTDPLLRVNFVIRADADGNQVLAREPVPAVPDELSASVSAPRNLPLEGRLLE